MDVKAALRSQYYAALEMLKKSILQCPESLWDATADTNKFWHVAYHALFFTHLYLQPSEKEFTRWVNHRENYQFLGALPWPPHTKPEIGEPYSKEDVLVYLEFCHAEVAAKVATIDFEAESGFFWLPSLNKLELQIYNIRHIQQHTGELMERLGTRENVELAWIATKSD